MGDHPDWPPTPRALYAGARCLAYLMVAVAGLDVTFGDAGSNAANGRSLWIDVIGLLAATSGAVGTVGTIFRRWQVEFVAVAVLAGSLLFYTLLDWYVLLFIVGYPPLPLASAAIVAGAAVVTAVATGRRRWRWTAIAGTVVVLGLAVPLEARGPAIITATTAFAAGRYIELWLFSDAAVRARRSRPGAAPELDP